MKILAGILLIAVLIGWVVSELIEQQAKYKERVNRSKSTL